MTQEGTLSPEATKPVGIEFDREGRRLLFDWADGRRSAFEWEFLRWRCPCAFCAGEGDLPGALEGRTSLRPEEIEMTDVNLVGRYAVQPTWKDGHDDGLFTFRGLRAYAEQNNLHLA